MPKCFPVPGPDCSSLTDQPLGVFVTHLSGTVLPTPYIFYTEIMLLPIYSRKLK